MVFLELRRQRGVSHELRRGTQGASRMVPGKSVLHSSYEGERSIALESWEGNLASRRVEEGLSRSFSGCSRKPWVPSPCASDLRELLRVIYVKSGILWSWEGPLGTPLGLLQWKTASSRVEAGTSGFLSISDFDHRVSAELEQQS